MYRLHLAGFDKPLVLADGQDPEEVLDGLAACCKAQRSMSVSVARGDMTIEYRVNPAAVAYWFVDEVPDQPTAIAFR
ncbi:hypothetical protein PG2029B_1091 [Bifidobacterium pseudolongum subsp. globosum]|uniref:Uncharacterized protein n=1 Tax=Bifidobacterium pseudolongum subsp. globosum TaxID=1690 RepID=A0A4Q5AFM2_9BIFI|nr:hypothetical protein [Bifidobacterium pseudolongum]RYQ26494.1 hypothetical protein PG2032B_1090 [Bifidobacterium pseudolongum subsp. globosum]RYQ28486.1 hypothetical protein PG2029B_1091 [Bifidobacterium pseudolongum subsp. globosum]